MKNIFRKFASKISQTAGSPYTFVFAMSLILFWAVSGPIFEYSTTWQLAVNTLTTIVTFLMVFLIQNTQNRDTKAVHLKLDELIRGMKGARDHLINVEEQTDEEIDQLQIEFQKLHDKYLRHLEASKKKRRATLREKNRKNN